jgi:hypothetical protein
VIVKVWVEGRKRNFGCFQKLRTTLEWRFCILRAGYRRNNEGGRGGKKRVRKERRTSNRESLGGGKKKKMWEHMMESHHF